MDITLAKGAEDINNYFLNKLQEKHLLKNVYSYILDDIIFNMFNDNIHIGFTDQKLHMIESIQIFDYKIPIQKILNRKLCYFTSHKIDKYKKEAIFLNHGLDYNKIFRVFLIQKALNLIIKHKNLIQSAKNIFNDSKKTDDLRYFYLMLLQNFITKKIKYTRRDEIIQYTDFNFNYHVTIQSDDNFWDTIAIIIIIYMKDFLEIKNYSSDKIFQRIINSINNKYDIN